MMRLELNVGCGVNKMVVAKVENNHSIQGTKRVMAKKALELIKEKWQGRSDYMEAFNRDYKEMVKRFMDQAYECYIKDESREYVEVAPVAKRQKKAGVMINAHTTKGVIAYEMQPYQTKVEAYKDLTLYVRKEENGNWILTEASTGWVIANSYSTKKELERQLECNAPQSEAIKQKIEDVVASCGHANPQLLPAATEETEIMEEIKMENKEVIVITEEIKHEVNTCYVTKDMRCKVKKFENFVRCYKLDENNKVVKYLDKEIKIDIHKDKFNQLVADGIIKYEGENNMEKVTFNPELTAIDTRNSKSAELIAEVATVETKVLDYGCGTGRNIKYIKNNSAAHVDGCDIPEQLEKEKDKHQKIIDERTVIAPASELENESYDIVLNSHVLNVIESDEVKKIVVADIFQKLKNGGKAVIEVRTKQDVEGAKTKEKYGDGWKIKKGSSFTYQEGISKEKMITLVTQAGFKIEEHIFNSTRHIIQVVK